MCQRFHEGSLTMEYRVHGVNNRLLGWLVGPRRFCMKPIRGSVQESRQLKRPWATYRGLTLYIIEVGVLLLSEYRTTIRSFINTSIHFTTL